MSSGHQLLSGNFNSFNTVNFIAGIDAEGLQILRWLSSLEPQKRHQSVRTDRLEGVGDWILQTDEFRKWSGAEDGCVEPVLFCYGNPGVGKTYLGSLVIDSLCDQAGEKGFAVVGLYCDYNTQEQSAAGMLGAMLRQLVRRGGIPEHIREAFQKSEQEFGGRGLRLPDLVEILKKTISSIPRVFICIDALDESAPKHRWGLLESLREIVRVSQNTRIFLTGRRHVNGEIVKGFRGENVLRICVSPTQADVKSYLEKRLDGDIDPDAMGDELRADIVRVIPEKVSEMLLIASLIMDAILDEIIPHQRRKKFDEMTKGEGLDDAYAATLSRVKAQPRGGSKLGMEVLMWVSHSERPLHVDELCHALGVEEGSNDLNCQNIPNIENLLACSLGLVTVEKSSSTVRLVHYTLQMYLSRDPNLFHKPHSTIAEVCLTYLNFQRIRGLSPALYSVPPTVPFVEYASCYWGAHARRETTESVKTLALKLLDEYDRHISSKMLLLHAVGFGGRPFDREDSPKGFTGLHGAAYLGCVEITVSLLEMKEWDARATDFNGNTAIAWAARMGHEEIVRILLQRSDVNPNTADTIYGQTPLSLAAENGHEKVVRILLERSDANPNTPDTKYGQTPLLWAAENGHVGVVKILLGQKDVNPNAADAIYGQTPLSWAAEKGHEKVVRILLERDDVNPNIADTTYGQTPLSLAAENGHEEIVRVLLERKDVNPNTADTKYGRTPLSWAAKNGHEEVVKILLGKDTNPNTAHTQSGRKPPSWAAGNGHEGVVRILAEQNDANPNTTDTRYGRTPHSWAAGNGREGVLGTLLARSDHPNTQERTDLIPRYSTSLRSTEPFSPEPSDLPELPSKRIRRS